jgi:hypothetical protein
MPGDLNLKMTPVTVAFKGFWGKKAAGGAVTNGYID